MARDSGRPLIAGLAAMAGLALGAVGAPPAEDGRPDIVLLAASGWRAEFPGRDENPERWMPAVASLAARGLRFRNAYTVSSAPAFAEASLLSGLYPSVIPSPQRAFPVPLAAAPFLPRRFREAGWYTVHIGAWRLGLPPERVGFEAAALAFGRGGADAGVRVCRFDGRVEQMGCHADDWIAEQAAETLMRSARPLFLVVIWQGPAGEPAWGEGGGPLPVLWDDELIGRPAYLPTGLHRARARAAGATNAAGAARVAAGYREALRALDRRIGRVLAALESRRSGRPVCVLLTSLHGWLAGEHGLIGAGLPYEPSIRVPLILVAPQVRGGEDERWALTVDVAPTLAALAGLAPAAPCHGRPLWPPAPDWREGILHELPAPREGARAAWCWREGPLKYVRSEMPGEPGALASEELYDLAADPFETNNLAIDRRRQGQIGALAGALRRAQCTIELDRRRLAGPDERPAKKEVMMRAR
ncbi:MAG: sulfatase-like hydrolase/transferase [Kiritimatiellae bacterium]|nr:sulfatase-like hydrolase/transferase [Kiritimatiellia bacterium]